MFIFFLFICFIISAFVLYILLKHDFVLARKSILLQEIFDITLVSYLAFIFSGRILFILSTQDYASLAPLRFFHFFKFPGLLFLGGIFGFALIVYLFLKKKKILLRVYDIYSLSIFPIFLLVLINSPNYGYFLYFNLIILFLSFLFLGIGIYSYKHFVLKDGSIAILFLLLVSIFTIITEFANKGRTLFSFFTASQVISIIIFIVFSTLLFIHEGFIGKKK